MRFLKFVVITFIIIIGIGYGVYHFGTGFIASKVTDVLAEELEKDDTLENIKVAIDQNPEIKEIIEEGATVDKSSLPFNTKEAAVEKIVKKIGINELNNIKAQYENGMTMSEMEQLATQIEAKLTEEELLALKAIAYDEIYR